jgi:glycine/D-amino acid oxidase-like deaminating enzyme
MLSFWEKNSFFKYDYAIVGGGILGFSVACEILENEPNAEVIILEKDTFPQGASTRNAGFACFGSPSEILSDIQLNGENTTAQLIAKRFAGLEKLKKRLGSAGIGEENNGGYELFLPENTEIWENTLKNWHYLQDFLQEIPIFQSQNFPIFSQLSQKNTQNMGFEQIIGATFTPLESGLDTGLMMHNLWKKASQLGARFLGNIKVNHIENNEIKANENLIFQAKKIIICTNGFTKEFLPDIPIQPARGQILLTHEMHVRFKGNFHFNEGYYYFRNYKNRVLLGGGRQLDKIGETTTQKRCTELIQNDLLEKLNTYILPNQPYQIDMRWAGIMGFTPDKQTILKFLEKNTLLCVGLNGMGVALSSSLAEDVYEKIAI